MQWAAMDGCIDSFDRSAGAIAFPLLHFKKNSTSEHPFWCFRLSQIEDSIKYLEGPNSTWKDHDKNLGLGSRRKDNASQDGPNIPIMVLPGIIWSFQVFNRVLYL